MTDFTTTEENEPHVPHLFHDVDRGYDCQTDTREWFVPFGKYFVDEYLRFASEQRCAIEEIEGWYAGSDHSSQTTADELLEVIVEAQSQRLTNRFVAMMTNLLKVGVASLEECAFDMEVRFECADWSQQSGHVDPVPFPDHPTMDLEICFHDTSGDKAA
jgi:hypothetical protein